MMKKSSVLSAAIMFILLAAGFKGLLFSCTMFTITKEGKTIIGNNEDDDTAFTEVWFAPKSPGKYGCIYFAFKDIQGLQGGLNEKGLVFDIFSAPYREILKSKNKKVCERNLYEKIMEECATIADVIKMLDRFNLTFLENLQLMFVDSSGDSIIVEGDDIIRKSGDFQVVTNFYHSRLKEGEDFPCKRYKMTFEAIRGWKTKEDLSVAACRKILAAVHNEYKSGGTLYSNIIDVKKKIIYLYHFHNFENVVVLDLKKELKKGKRIVDLASLFPTTFAAESYRERYKMSKRKSIIMDPAKSDMILGTYRTKSGRKITIRKEKRIYIIGEGNRKYEILPEAENKFFYKDHEIYLTFIKDKNGKVTDIILDSGKKLELKKINDN